MNRKGFLKTLGALVSLPFVTPAMAVEKQWMDKLPKKVQTQTKVEQKKLDNFYEGNHTYGLSGVYCITGSYPSFAVSGTVSPELAAKYRKDGIW